MDGNKRTAAASTAAFIYANDASWAPSKDDLVEVFVRIASRQLSRQQTEHIFRKWIEASDAGLGQDRLSYEACMSTDDLIDPLVKRFKERRSQANDEIESRQGERVLEQQFAECACDMGPDELRKMEELLWDRWSSIAQSIGDLPEFHYNKISHSLESDRALYGVVMDVSEGSTYAVEITVGLDRSAHLKTAQLPDVDPKRWSLRASYDETGFRWLNTRYSRWVDTESIVEEMLESLLEFLN